MIIAMKTCPIAVIQFVLKLNVKRILKMIVLVMKISANSTKIIDNAAMANAFLAHFNATIVNQTSIALIKLDQCVVHLQINVPSLKNAHA